MIHMMLMGYLGADPEVRFGPSGQKITTFRMAVNQRRGGKDVTLWWRITIWGEQFDRMMPYIKKGAGLIVQGEMMEPEIYTDRDGQPRVSLNLVAHRLDFPPFGKKGIEQSTQQQQEKFGFDHKQTGQGEMNKKEQGQGEEESMLFEEDEIPF